MSSLPTPLRAALGVALTAVDAARETATSLPQKAVGLPIALASSAVQLSLRAQQQYAAYVVKGDELIGAFRGAPEEPPAWATFDDDNAAGAGPTPARNTAFDRVGDVDDVIDDIEEMIAQAAGETFEDSAELLADELLDELGDDAIVSQSTPADPPVDEVVINDDARTTAPREPAKKAAELAKRPPRAAKKTAPTAKKAVPAVKRAAPAARKAAPRAKQAVPATPRTPTRERAAAAELAGTTLEGGPLEPPTS